MQYRIQMNWVVELLDDRIRAELEDLPVDIEARFGRIVELIQSYGLERVREPHVKHIQGPLWEMRLKGRDGIARAVYDGQRQSRRCDLEMPRREIEKACKELRRYRIDETHEG